MSWTFHVIATIALTTLLPISLDAGEPASAASRVLNGTQHPASDFPTVGLVTNIAGTFICSGTLIDPRHVLTAGHCASSPEMTVGDMEGVVIFGASSFSTSRVIIHPSYNLNLVGSDGIIDAAIFELSTPVTGVTPSSILRHAPAAGAGVLIVGYGEISSKGNLPPADSVFSGTNVIQNVNASTLEWKFSRGTSGFAPGDSGGPSFVTENGVALVAGLHSLLSSTGGHFTSIGTTDIDTRVDTMAPWIDSILNNAAAAPTALISSTTIVPSPTTVGQNVTLDVSVSSSAANAPLSVWDFGDGTSAVGETQTHPYDFPGTYTATVTVSDGVVGVTSSGNVMVTAGTAGNLPLKKLQLSVNFANKFHDGVACTGTLIPFSVSDLTSATLRINVGGASSTFQLDARGHGRNGDGRVQLNPKNGNISVTLTNDDLNAFWTKFGMVNDDRKNAQVFMPVTVVLNNNAFITTQTLSYSSQVGKSGKAK